MPKWLKYANFFSVAAWNRAMARSGGAFERISNDVTYCTAGVVSTKLQCTDKEPGQHGKTAQSKQPTCFGPSQAAKYWSLVCGCALPWLGWYEYSGEYWSWLNGRTAEWQNGRIYDHTFWLSKCSYVVTTASCSVVLLPSFPSACMNDWMKHKRRNANCLA